MDRDNLTTIENFDDSRGCFGCGPDNPAGLRMTFQTDGRTVYSWLSVPQQLCGWRHIVHGGIVATILDEAMSWTAHHMIRKLILTKSIEVTFLSPLYVERELQVRGRVLQADHEREARLSAEIRNEADKPCARAVGTFALLTPRVARRLGVIDESIIRKFEAFMAGGSGAVPAQAAPSRPGEIGKAR